MGLNFSNQQPFIAVLSPSPESHRPTLIKTDQWTVLWCHMGHCTPNSRRWSTKSSKMDNRQNKGVNKVRNDVIWHTKRQQLRFGVNKSSIHLKGIQGIGLQICKIKTFHLFFTSSKMCLRAKTLKGHFKKHGIEFNIKNLLCDPFNLLLRIFYFLGLIFHIRCTFYFCAIIFLLIFQSKFGIYCTWKKSP